MADIRYSDEGFEAETFVALAKRVWPREYDLAAAAAALTRTTNIGAWDGERLVGAVRMLTDGYFFATVPEILVDPEYRRRGTGHPGWTRFEFTSMIHPCLGHRHRPPCCPSLPRKNSRNDARWPSTLSSSPWWNLFSTR
jgi:GNAT superfamily N-acetyltransferase